MLGMREAEVTTHTAVHSHDSPGFSEQNNEIFAQDGIRNEWI
jgi:hypothetical protein